MKVVGVLLLVFFPFVVKAQFSISQAYKCGGAEIYKCDAALPDPFVLQTLPGIKVIAGDCSGDYPKCPDGSGYGNGYYDFLATFDCEKGIVTVEKNNLYGITKCFPLCGKQCPVGGFKDVDPFKDKNHAYKCGDIIYKCDELIEDDLVHQVLGEGTIFYSGYCSDYWCRFEGKTLDLFASFKCINEGFRVCDAQSCTIKCSSKCGSECPTGSFGDPHFRTLDGSFFSYHGQCDLVMARSPSFDSGLGLVVHARTKIVDGWSLISNAAVKIGDDIFELNHNGSYYLNGIENANQPILLAGKYSLTIGEDTIGNPDEGSTVQTWYTIELENGQNIQIKNFRTMISVTVNAHLDDTAGMLGMANKIGLVGRDGKTIIESYNEFGSEWQVLDSEPMLFQEARSPQFPEKCILPSVPNRRLLRATDDLKLHADKACAGVKDSAMRNFCVEDVLMTGDLVTALQYGNLM